MNLSSEKKYKINKIFRRRVITFFSIIVDGSRLHNDSLQTEVKIKEFQACLKENSSVFLCPNPGYSSITSLPLWLYSGYMLLQKLDLMKEYGSVSFWGFLSSNTLVIIIMHVQ